MKLEEQYACAFYSPVFHQKIERAFCKMQNKNMNAAINDKNNVAAAC